MLAETTDPKPRELYIGDALLASLEAALELPATVTKDKLKGPARRTQYVAGCRYRAADWLRG